MNKEFFHNRISELSNARNQLNSQLQNLEMQKNQLLANINAYNGAIEENMNHVKTMELEPVCVEQCLPESPSCQAEVSN